MKIGAKVVCINDQFTDIQKQLIPNRPVKDEQYTIQDILVTRNGKGVTLEEISNPDLPHPSGGGSFPASFSIGRFREVDPTDELVLVEDDKIYA